MDLQIDGLKGSIHHESLRITFDPLNYF